MTLLKYIREKLREADTFLTGEWPQPGQYAMECPAGWQASVPRASVPKEKTHPNVYTLDENSGEYFFRDKDFNKPSGNTSGGQGMPYITEFDAGLIRERFGELSPKAWERAKDAKVLWSENVGKEKASEYLRGKGYKASVSYVEKIFGTYSAALENENISASALQN